MEQGVNGAGESGNALPLAHGPEQQGVAVLGPHSGWGNPGDAADLVGALRPLDYLIDRVCRRFGLQNFLVSNSSWLYYRIRLQIL